MAHGSGDSACDDHALAHSHRDACLRTMLPAGLAPLVTRFFIPAAGKTPEARF